MLSKFGLTLRQVSEFHESGFNFLFKVHFMLKRPKCSKPTLFRTKVNNPYYWSSVGIWPMSIGMGITEQQRSAIRQAVEDAFAPPSNVGMVGR